MEARLLGRIKAKKSGPKNILKKERARRTKLCKQSNPHKLGWDIISIPSKYGDTEKVC